MYSEYMPYISQYGFNIEYENYYRGWKIIETKVRPMNEIWQNMREECMDNSNGERQKALTRLEQLRKKGTVVDDKAELDSYREEKFGRSYFDEKGNIK